jgi:nucleoside-diphosphate-sugar epimerase
MRKIAMLTHQWPEGKKPARVVTLGASGFLARYLRQRLETGGITVRPIGSEKLDLSADDGSKRLGELLDANDSLVILSAITPDKGNDVAAFMTNLAMGRTICEALAAQPVAHVIYVSSDAVYPFTDAVVTEESVATPTDLYSAMHRAREIMIGTATDAPYAILRPTMVLGAGDTHNSYGPNRFRRQAASEGRIVLGGGGEETRDHIDIEDAISLIELVLRHRSAGLLNLATGQSIAFVDLARMAANFFDPPALIEITERILPMTHRSFDPAAIHTAFPNFRFTSRKEALGKAHATEIEKFYS